jgi:hypothetical protein
MTWVGIRLSSGSRRPQSTKSLPRRRTLIQLEIGLTPVQLRTPNDLWSISWLLARPLIANQPRVMIFTIF